MRFRVEFFRGISHKSFGPFREVVVGEDSVMADGHRIALRYEGSYVGPWSEATDDEVSDAEWQGFRITEWDDTP